MIVIKTQKFNILLTYFTNDTEKFIINIDSYFKLKRLLVKDRDYILNIMIFIAMLFLFNDKSFQKINFKR